MTTAWPSERLKFAVCTPVKNGIGASAEFDDPSWPRYIRITDIAGARALRPDTFRSLPPEVAREAPIKVGDIFAAAVGATFGKTYLHAVDIGPACYAGYLARISLSDRFDPQFVSYWTESQHYWDQVRSRVVQATIQNFSASKYADLVLPAPRLDVQRATTTFLDRKTAAIDGLIAQKERLIELLQEKRQALLTEAVTKGLDPKVSMKDSGIKWLGTIPHSWEVLRGRFLLKSYGGYAPEAVEETEDVGAIDYYKVEDLNQETGSATLDRAERKIRAAGLEILYPPAILIPKRGAAIFTNKVRLIPAACTIDSNVMGLKVLGGHDAEFLALSLLSRGLSDVADVSTIPQINNKHIKELFFAVPPPAEQKRIVAGVTERLGRLRRLADAVAAHIDRLHEYRQTLISVAVTGKIEIPAEEAA